MIDRWLRRRVEGPLSRIAGVAGGAGLSPNILSATGFLLMVVAGILAARGSSTGAGMMVALGGFFDALDGSLARARGCGTTFGSFFDSFLDRYGEIVVFAGLLVRFAGSPTGTILVFAAVTGSLMVSYARARAEGVGVACASGICTRLERMLILIAGLLTGYMIPALLVLSVLTHLTALQRMMLVWRSTGESG
ncbi:MAG: CDP-alcohol phosphatidyltransferase family protein [Methanoculleaceae archaeon]